MQGAGLNEPWRVCQRSPWRVAVAACRAGLVTLPHCGRLIDNLGHGASSAAVLGEGDGGNAPRFRLSPPMYNNAKCDRKIAQIDCLSTNGSEVSRLREGQKIFATSTPSGSVVAIPGRLQSHLGDRLTSWRPGVRRCEERLAVQVVHICGIVLWTRHKWRVA